VTLILFELIKNFVYKMFNIYFYFLAIVKMIKFYIIACKTFFFT